jgi:hypothetical protein
MKKESAALFEHAEEFNFAAHVSLSELGNITDERVEIRVHVAQLSLLRPAFK